MIRRDRDSKMILDLFSNFKWVRRNEAITNLSDRASKERMKKAFGGPNLVSRNGDGG